MNKNLIIIGVVVVIIAAFAFADSDSVKSTPEYEAAIAPAQTSVFETGYMSGCTEETDGSREWERYCQCTYDYIDNRLTEAQFEALADKFERDEIEPQIMIDAVEYCL